MTTAMSLNVCGAVLTRRQFVKSGGALIVGAAVMGHNVLHHGRAAAQGAPAGNSLDASLVSSWFEIRADGTLVLHTGKVDFGQSTVTTAFRQLVAEELNFPYESITSVVMGDTDRTPDGGLSAALLKYGGENLRKVAAYTQQALLDLASTRLGVDRSELTAKDGVISGGGKRVTYGELVTGQQLTLQIPVSGDLTGFRGLIVEGNPPMKPVSQYTVIGKSYPNYVTELKVRGKEAWITDLRLPGMLHGRVVHPRTLGSTLTQAGTVDAARFPNARVIVKGNLVGVVAPTEWEAINAAQQVGASTQWTDWKGLPGSDNLFTALRGADWKAVPPLKGGKNQGDTGPALASAAKTLTASYELPYLKHAPIGPAIAIADVKPNGTVYVYVRSQNPSVLRRQIATMLETSIDKVVIRTLAGTGHYGRSNGGNSGAEDEAVILSQAVGRPVRVQWMRPDDFQWSTSSSAAYCDVRIGLDSAGRIVGAQLDHHMPAMNDDRLIGAVLAGLPTIPAPEAAPARGSGGAGIVNSMQDPWLYDRVPNLAELGHGTFQLGQKASPIAAGIRDKSLRTPGQYQQNFPRELAMTEAASLAGADPLEFRISHTSDTRLIGVLNAVRDASGWERRPSPRATAKAAGAAPVRGQGVSVMLREGSYWACVCQVTVDTASGKVTVDRYSIAVDPGIVINPLQLKRQIQGGAIMGISHTLYEETRFDESQITSRDWRSYPIATLADVPEMNVVILNTPEAGRFGQGSEAANALAIAAIAAAVFDATGAVPRRTPLTPAYVQSLLKAPPLG